jgi:hypothetical protein
MFQPLIRAFRRLNRRRIARREHKALTRQLDAYALSELGFPPATPKPRRRRRF